MSKSQIVFLPCGADPEPPDDIKQEDVRLQTVSTHFTNTAFPPIPVNEVDLCTQAW